MIEILCFIWILLFLIFFVANIVTDNAVFGIVAGVILLLFALGIIIDGMQFTTGMEINTVNGTQILTNQYAEITAPFSSWGVIFGITLIAISIYIFYANASNL